MLREWFKPKAEKLLCWAVCPGNDFDKAWAAWLLRSGWGYDLWAALIERPYCRLFCKVYGHTREGTREGLLYCRVCYTEEL